MTNKYFKKVLLIFSNQENQIKTALKFYIIPDRMAKIIIKNNKMKTNAG